FGATDGGFVGGRCSRTGNDEAPLRQSIASRVPVIKRTTERMPFRQAMLNRRFTMFVQNAFRWSFESGLEPHGAKQFYGVGKRHECFELSTPADFWRRRNGTGSGLSSR